MAAGSITQSMGPQQTPGQTPEYAQTQQPAAPPPSPSDLMGQTYQNASDFRKNMGDYSNQLYAGAADEAKNKLAGQTGQIRTNANSRGLLYSGLRQGAESAATSTAASGLAAKRMQINQGLESMAQGYDSGAINAGLDQYKGDVAAAFNSYQQALNDRQMQNQGLGQLLGAVGTGAAVAAAI